MEEERIKEFLKKKSCKGCSNGCSLAYPGCARSKTYINSAIQEFQNQNDKNSTQWKNMSIF